jgi:hypothetical protein
MTIYPIPQRIIVKEPYPLSFATVRGRTVADFGRRTRF